MNVDYQQIAQPVILTFTENMQFLCVNISVLPDAIVESIEMFTLLLTSNDSVSFNLSSALVFIMDSDQGALVQGMIYTKHKADCMQMILMIC